MDPVKDFYENYYSQVFSKNGLSSLFNSLTHKALELGVKNHKKVGEILEIGAGKGEHYKFVKQEFENYSMLDLFSRPKDFDEFLNANWIQADICDTNLDLQSYDRILLMCVLHHLSDPVSAIQNIKKFLKPGGTVSIFLPSDPGMLNRLNRKLFVTPSARKLGFCDYELVNAREHRNHYWALKKELEFQFEGYKISRKYYPFGLQAGNLSLFSIWTIQSKNH
jgi:phosphatidylethanolamine/phosphatidyl-N-methylethanolamine N-methyltransferase